MKVAVAGLGGLGSMAVKFAVAFGCHVTVISRGTAKKAEAISAKHDVRSLIHMTATNGKVILVGASPENLEIHAFDLIPKRKSIVGSLIGGIKET